MSAHTIPRPIELVIGANKIGKFLGVREASVQKMLKSGAPIVRRGERGALVCEKAEMWAWYKASCAQSAGIG